MEDPDPGGKKCKLGAEAGPRVLNILALEPTTISSSSTLPMSERNFFTLQCSELGISLLNPSRERAVPF